MYNLQSALQNTKISELNENVLSQAEKSSVSVNAYSYGESFLHTYIFMKDKSIPS